MPKTKAKEHPIIFNDWSINRILAGEKTQTRRIVKPQAHHYNTDMLRPWVMYPCEEGDPFGDESIEITCPYGQPGDVLWVREGYRIDGGANRRVSGIYTADDEAFDTMLTPEEWAKWQDRTYPHRESPARYMYRSLCRLRLRVEDVGVERIQDISPEDAHAEGVTLDDVSPPAGPPKSHQEAEIMQDQALYDGFQKKWNDIHGDGAWERNDWVWKISFSRIDE